MTLQVGWDTDLEETDPSGDLVASAIQSMDGTTRDQVLLTLGDMDFLLIGGGPETFIVSVQRPDSSLTAQNPTAIGMVRLQSGGQAAEFPAHIVVTRNVALQAARHYLQTGRPDPALVWAAD
jgi:hypothetical protein